MTEKIEQIDSALGMLSSTSVVRPHNKQHDPILLDYSLYFEPITDTALLMRESIENTGCGIPDFSPYFEPVASTEQNQRIFR